EEDAVPFGLSLFDMAATDESGEGDPQAASHPFELVTTLAFSVAGRESPSKSNNDSEAPLSPGAARDVEIALPPGLVGDPAAVPRCSQRAFLEGEGDDCPLDTQVGTVKPFFYGALLSAVFPVYDIAPPPGTPAELGFTINGIGHVPVLFHVRSGADYGLTAQLEEIPEIGPLQGAILTLWGVPAAASHDLEREGTSPEEGEPVCQPRISTSEGVEKAIGCPSGVAAKPFLTLPTRCQPSPLTASLSSDSWEEPEAWSALQAPVAEAITGCESLSFTPSIALAPEKTQAGAPSGYTLDVHIPQDEDPDALATPDLRTAVVSLPAGLTLSPSAGNGLQACSPAQFELHSSGAAACPAASQLGTVRVTTPLLEAPLEGHVFLGEPQCAPCSPSDAQAGRLLRMLVVAQGSGVTVKLEGSVSIDQATGQLTARFEEVPQLPIEDVRLSFEGGSNALLENPATCAVPLAASARLTPYSSETPALATSEPFALDACQAPQFHPSFLVGTTDNAAGASSPLTVSVTRGEQEESLGSVSMRLPPGLLAMVSKVPELCTAAQAGDDACPAQSEVGTAAVTAGPGAAPLALTGTVYLTGPYEGAPFGLSVVVPAQAGPLDLGTIVLEAGIHVDPSTAAVSVTTDPLPQSLDGMPLQIRTIALDLDREGFVRNPTDCRALAVTGTLTSSAGTVAPASTRFQAADCARLAFKPKLTALTHARARKATGVHLHVRVVSPAGQANIAALKLDLPKQMVPRLSTLQHACAASAFAANPAKCPAASVLGSATALTPMLRQPLSGPVYVLSRGRAGAPEVALVLQGEGVSIEVIGQATVKGGVDSVAFASLPDAPLSELDVLLEAGPHSLLAANLPAKAHGSMCGRRLTMPTEITGQNGAVLKQTTKITISGCAKPKRKASKRKVSKRKASKHKRASGKR
ncbi:MAG TPA: hypothetical protein VKV16_00535, partial [Solirubrobacteraceae bacterium]|nr:hypothetical protein [Solirubrobacteraceae bacterium]